MLHMDAADIVTDAGFKARDRCPRCSIQGVFSNADGIHFSFAERAAGTPAAGGLLVSEISYE